MDKLHSALDWLLSPSVLAEVAALAIAIVAARLAYGVVRKWYAARPENPADVGTRLLEMSVVCLPYVGAAAVALLGRFVVAASGLDTAVIDQAIRLLVALVLIRAAVYLLRQSLPRQAAFRLWENRIALVIWAVVAMELLGWAEDVVRVLDSLALTTGKVRISAWSVIAAVITVSVFVIVSVWIARWIDRRISKVEALEHSTRIGISKSAYAFFIGFGVLAGLHASGVDLTALTVFSGAIGLGLGFGLQAIAANFVSGFVLLMDKSIKPGDVISFTGTTGTSTHGFGWVESLRGRYIVVRDRDGVATLVPNQNVINNQVINWSFDNPRVRLRLPVRISYDDDAELALRLVLEAAGDHPRILKDPGPVSRLMDFTDYGMEIEVRFWIVDPAAGVNNVRSDVNRRIWALFRQHGITIPPAQREIRILEGVASASRLAPRSTGRIEPTLDGQD